MFRFARVATLLAVVASMSTVAPLAALQPVAGDWSTVDRQPSGTAIVIALVTTEEVRGTVAGSTDSDLSVLLPSGDRRTFPKTLVSEVRTAGLAKDSLANGMSYGALVGAATVAAIVIAGYAGCDAGCEAPAFPELFFPAVALGAGIGLGGGAAVDAVHRRPSILYRAARADQSSKR